MYQSVLCTAAVSFPGYKWLVLTLNFGTHIFFIWWQQMYLTIWSVDGHKLMVAPHTKNNFSKLYSSSQCEDMRFDFFLCYVECNSCNILFGSFIYIFWCWMWFLYVSWRLVHTTGCITVPPFPLYRLLLHEVAKKFHSSDTWKFSSRKFKNSLQFLCCELSPSPK
jgi:hypothetical protein